MAQGISPDVRDLLRYIHASPTPRHCVRESAIRLEEAGFKPVNITDDWSKQSKAYVVRDGTLVAWAFGEGEGFRIVGAHTDSPNLRIKPHPSRNKDGYVQLNVEPYGGLLAYTWLDRDLGIAGDVVVREGDELNRLPLRIDQPVARIPSLAIHLNRELGKDGLKVNHQDHLPAILAVGDEHAFDAWLAAELDVDPLRILAWDLSLFDLAPPAIGGARQDFIFSSRLDNQAMCHAAIRAISRVREHGATSVICLYDHEEVGSQSVGGAAGAFVETVLGWLAEHHGGWDRVVASSFQISSDMAHAIHPNYADRHEQEHRPAMNAGPVIKFNSNQRYATDALSAALFEDLAQSRGVPVQRYVNRSDLPCGSTIGPISSARLGIRTVDAGNAMLSMHSIREQCGTNDHGYMIDVFQELFERDLLGIE